ncbi:uncharacterized protein [Dysidea avara]|uniref:uncharacterized protein isoform X1 n=1 Tax=Dysidea avara TaxID=196820 RepID=UPI00332B9959
MDRGKLEGYECALEVIICDCGFEFILTEMLENRDTCRPSAVWTNFNLNMLVRLASARHPKYRLQERRGGFRPTLRRVVIGRRPTKMVHQITLGP